MANNQSQVRAKKNVNDEFYTRYEDIQNEINAYIEYNKDVFRDKIILCPCDDPEWSNFTRFFVENFDYLGIKKLISTSYSINAKKDKYGYNYERTLFEVNSGKYDETISDDRGKIFTLSRSDNKTVNSDNLEWDYLVGDGDFRSDEVICLRDEADIIVTNPPFSLFDEFIKWLFDGEKQFIIIGNITKTTYRDIFPLIKGEKMWLGKGFAGDNAYFRIPEDSETEYVEGVYDEKKSMVKFRNCCWYTNVDHGRRHKPLKLMTMSENRKYSKHKDIRENGYIKYDNYDAIEVNYTDAIPSDYDGIMGVAGSFLKNYCPEQFEIVAATQTGCHPDDMIKRTYKDYKGYKQNGKPTGRTGSTCGHNPMLLRNDGIHDYYRNDEGREVQSANGRILIRRRNV